MNDTCVFCIATYCINIVRTSLPLLDTFTISRIMYCTPLNLSAKTYHVGNKKHDLHMKLALRNPVRSRFLDPTLFEPFVSTQQILLGSLDLRNSSLPL